MGLADSLLGGITCIRLMASYLDSYMIENATTYLTPKAIWFYFMERNGIICLLFLYTLSFILIKFV
jgi:hypothetical protein